MRVDPVFELDRPDLLEYGLELGRGILRRLEIPEPIVEVHWPTPHRHPERGWYRGVRLGEKRVTINLPRCRLPTRVPGYAWSFPGYKADLTPIGVVTHEFGHHVDAWLKYPHLPGWRSEAPVSGYEPNRGEAFAEALRLFCTNPDLLRVGRPVRWGFFAERAGEIGELAPWEDVLRLRGAHERFISAARNWIRR